MYINLNKKISRKKYYIFSHDPRRVRRHVTIVPCITAVP